MTTAPKSKQRLGKFWKYSIEAAFPLGFILTFLWGQGLVGQEGVTTAERLVGALVPISLLTGWFAFYAWQVRRMDEFERHLELLSLAVAGGVAMWGVIVWGVISTFMGLNPGQLMMAAPVVAGAYGLVRGYMMVRFR